MKKGDLFFLFMLFALLGCETSEKHDVLIKHVNLFDGENYAQNVNIIIDGNKISKITVSEDAPDANQIINGEGKTVIPPLLNAHVHVWGQRNLMEAMRSGVFGLLDMHTTDEAAKLMRQYRDSARYAYYYSSNAGLTVPGGHGTQFGVKVPVVTDSLSPKKFVEDRVENGADYIKILREPYFKTVTFDHTKEAIDAAHHHSKLCVAHISLLYDALVLSNQNVDGLVHIWFDKMINETQLDSFAREDVFVVPTLYVTKLALEELKIGERNKQLLSFEQVLRETKKLYKKGILLLAGTDAPNYRFNYGDDLFKEMKLLSEAGLSNMDVLKSATSNIYKAFKLSEFVPLKKGAPASFIIVNGNPVERIEDIGKIQEVWKNGKKLPGKTNTWSKLF